MYKTNFFFFYSLFTLKTSDSVRQTNGVYEDRNYYTIAIFSIRLVRNNNILEIEATIWFFRCNIFKEVSFDRIINGLILLGIYFAVLVLTVLKIETLYK